MAGQPQLDISGPEAMFWLLRIHAAALPLSKPATHFCSMLPPSLCPDGCLAIKKLQSFSITCLPQSY